MLTPLLWTKCIIIEIMIVDNNHEDRQNSAENVSEILQEKQIEKSVVDPIEEDTSMIINSGDSNIDGTGNNF